MLNDSRNTSSYISKVCTPSEWIFVRQLFFRLFLILLIYLLFRVVFIASYWEVLHTVYVHVTPKNLLWILYEGMKIDFIVILFINTPIILLHLLPFSFRNHSVYQMILRILLISGNAIFFFIEIADIFYYQHAMERSSGAIIGMLDGFWLMFYNYSIEYWYGWLFLFVILLAFYRVDRYMAETSTPLTTLPVQVLIFFLILTPSLISASKITGTFPGNATAVTTNTSFIVLNDLFHSGSFSSNRRLTEYSFLKPEEIENILITKKDYHKPEETTKNFHVLILVLESFSRQYIGFFHEEEKSSHTPFLDSLSSQSLVFSNAFANGRTSNSAVSSIFASIPALMRQPMISSQYKYNNINGLAALLGQKEYSSAFFMGSPNGLYGFDFFSRRAGFQKYVGMNEYGNDEHYDGAWGIYDDRFFLFTADRLNEMDGPFVAALWSLSSHHPFLTPPDYEDDLEKPGDHPIMKTVRYTDYSLKLFFEKIREMPWYEHTLFVITADHTAIANNHTPYYSTALGTHRIPLLFYKPGSELTGVRDDVVQHIDIVPSVIDYLNLDIPFKSMGKSVFHDYEERYVYHYYNRLFQIAGHDLLLQFDGEQVVSLYNHRKDSLLQENLLQHGEKPPYEMLNHLKAIMQFYNEAMNHNRFANH